MTPESIPWGAFDVLTALVLTLGLLRGRKRGLSGELLDTLSWLTIVVIGGSCSPLLFQILDSDEVSEQLAINLTFYASAAVLLRLAFVFLKHRVGKRIAEADWFGGGEYYLGMVAGMVRFACIYFFLMNFLHAPLYTPEKLASEAREQEQEYGSARRITLGTVQHAFFKKSATGWAAETYLSDLLIQPRSTTNAGPTNTSPATTSAAAKP